jgi:hypothetical protein
MEKERKKGQRGRRREEEIYIDRETIRNVFRQDYIEEKFN